MAPHPKGTAGSQPNAYESQGKRGRKGVIILHSDEEHHEAVYSQPLLTATVT